MTAEPPVAEPPNIPPAARLPSAPPVAARRAASTPGALDLIDEAALRLRLAPLGTLAVYYAGSLPFALALLYFWTDMGRNPDAARDAPGAALGMTALFLAMKTAQAVFTARLRAQFARQPDAPWTLARVGRVALVQAILQPTGLFLLPLAAIITVPLGWAYAFYSNVTVLGDGSPDATPRAVCVRAARHALRNPKGNHLALTIVSLFGLFAWINLAIATLGLPQLAKMFTGEENVFTLSGLHIFNSTFFAVTFALVYLALDPLVKTFYALRCFYADARTSGEDLTSGLRALPAVLTTAACLLLALAAAPAARAAATAATPPPAARGPANVDSVSTGALGRSVQDVLHRREFAWRSPRTALAPDPGQTGPVGHFLDGVKAWIASAWHRVGDFFGKITDWLRRWWNARQDADREDGPGRGGLDPATLRWLVYGLTALVAAALTGLLWQGWRARRGGILKGQPVPAGPAAMPDLADETVLASQLPEDEWRRLAQDLQARGERRLALRALYLSTLAGLGARGWLAVARHKSNRDYLRELHRRARDRAGVPEAFARNVGRFERVWYGPHPADDGLLADFQADHERTLAGA